MPFLQRVTHHFVFKKYYVYKKINNNSTKITLFILVLLLIICLPLGSCVIMHVYFILFFKLFFNDIN